MRYFLASDNDGHWYLVEAEKRVEWDAWCALASDDERAWEAPEFAARIVGSPENVTFEAPKDLE